MADTSLPRSTPESSPPDALPRVLRDCGSDRLDVTGRSAAGIQAAVLHLHQTATVHGIILGEDDFLADAKAKVDQMLERARAQARATPSPKR